MSPQVEVAIDIAATPERIWARLIAGLKRRNEAMRSNR